MTTLTLPATIPGLLRRCSPARFVSTMLPCEVLLVDGAWAWCAYVVRHPDYDDDGTIVTEDPLSLGDLALDLTDATGCAHAAWWVRSAESATFAPSLVEIEYVDEAAKGEPMDATGIAILCRVVLRLAIYNHPNHPHVNDWRAALEAA